MTLDRAYASARQLIDPDADYTVHVRAGNGWQSPGNRDQQELPGLDVLLAARRVLRAQPAGRVWSTRPDTLNVCTGDGLLWLRFTVTTLAETGLCDAAECAEFLTDSGHCPRCAAGPSPGPGGHAPTGVWKVLGLADSAVLPVTRDDLTTTDLVLLARACHTLDQQHHAVHARTPLPPEAKPLLQRLALVLDDLDEGRPHPLNPDVVFSRAELLTLADTALALYRAHGDPDDLLGSPTVLRLAHLAYADMPE
ncbi:MULTISPECIES: hypothetical protein [unclassified Streptomyces]|uniref:hypothetical protein n=1 Tax=unclassified Streptomyces TaxID=2593676 RepID=UPI0003D89D67|nr:MULTISPECIES: hypothetical protein [unclassified Streptomyces]AHE40022.1 Hypothetical protein pFRL5_359c [Streptomyces sp. F8]